MDQNKDEKYQSEMADQDAHAQAVIQDEYEHDMHITRQMNSTAVRMDELRDLTKERDTMVADIDSRIAILQDSIKRDCTESGETIKTQFGTVTFRRGGKRTSWNGKHLEGLALVYHEINECKKTTDTAANAAIKLDV
ncbi:MAG: hypothetical protein KAJ03_11470 [Gammaproteobacteria bacterium]|nr:hypothetical protein [Gammaproteobacteria bacterium]